MPPPDCADSLVEEVCDLTSGHAMKNWSVGKQLGFSFSLFVLFILGLGAFTVSTMRDAANAVSGISDAYLPEMALTGAFEREVLNARIFFIYHVTIQKPGALESGWKRFRNAQGLLPKLKAQVAATPSLASLRKPTTQLAENMIRYEVLLRQILTVVEKHQNKGPQFALTIKEWAALGANLVTTAGDLNQRCTEMSTRSSHSYAESLQNNTWSALGICVGTALLGLLAGSLIARRIGRTLTATARELSSSAQYMATASAQLSTAADGLNCGASEQASSLQQTHRTCDEIAAMAKSNAAISGTMAQTMQESQMRSQKTNETLGRMKQAMTDITASGKRVSEIIEMIDGIAVQTNLLGFNASVEAARAGVHGLSFAVVANEVRDLAQKSAQAAKDTNSVIAESKEKTNAGEAQVELAVGSMREIIAEFTRAKKLADEVNARSREQNDGVSRISRSIAQLEKVTLQTAGAAKRMGGAASDLSSHSLAMTTLSERLMVLVGSTGRKNLIGRMATVVR